MDPKCSTILVIILGPAKDEHLSMPHPEERWCSRIHVQTLQRIDGRYYTSSSLSANRVPTRI